MMILGEVDVLYACVKDESGTLQEVVEGIGECWLREG